MVFFEAYSDDEAYATALQEVDRDLGIPSSLDETTPRILDAATTEGKISRALTYNL